MYPDQQQRMIDEEKRLHEDRVGRIAMQFEVEGAIRPEALAALNSFGEGDSFLGGDVTHAPDSKAARGDGILPSQHYGNDKPLISSDPTSAAVPPLTPTTWAEAEAEREKWFAQRDALHQEEDGQ